MIYEKNKNKVTYSFLSKRLIYILKPSRSQVYLFLYLVLTFILYSTSWSLDIYAYVYVYVDTINGRHNLAKKNCIVKVTLEDYKFTVIFN